MFYFNYEFYQLSKSRTAFLLWISSDHCLFYFKICKKKIYEFKISLILLEIGNLVGIFLSIYYGLYSQLTDPTFMRLDQLITGRLTVARNCFLGAGIPLFGSNIGGKVCGYGIYTQANDGYVTELGIVRTLLE